jgi:uncharacterized protein with GYD domain
MFIIPWQCTPIYFALLSKALVTSRDRQYWTLGPYDGVLIISADEPKKGAHCLAELASFGNVSVQTLTAFKDTKIAEIMET